MGARKGRIPIGHLPEVHHPLRARAPHQLGWQLYESLEKAD
jgi:hypothetical protein